MENNQDGSANHPYAGVQGKRVNLDSGDRKKLLFLVFSILRKLGADERPEVDSSPKD